MVTHVDDIEGGVANNLLTDAFSKSSLALELATNHVKSFIFRGPPAGAWPHRCHENGVMQGASERHALQIWYV